MIVVEPGRFKSDVAFWHSIGGKEEAISKERTFVHRYSGSLPSFPVRSPKHQTHSEFEVPESLLADKKSVLCVPSCNRFQLLTAQEATPSHHYSTFN